MTSLPSILKRFTRPKAEAYKFQEAMELVSDLELPDQEQPSISKEENHVDSPASSAGEKLDFASTQAEAIVRDAEARAEEMIANARREAEQAAEEIRRRAAEEGSQQGYADGLDRAAQEAAAQRAQESAAMTAEIERFLNHAAQAKEEALDSMRSELLDLTVAVAEKVVHVSLKSSSDVISRMILAATEKLKRREWVRIYIAGSDAKEVQTDATLAARLNGLSDQVKILPMARAGTGTCIIELPDEIIDASASTQLENIRGILHESIL